MISGVRIKELQLIPDERGGLMEMLRSDDDIFIKFGQVYITTVYPGVVKGWHYHKIQTDNFVAVKGMIKLVLYDDRQDSPTYGEVNEFFIGERNRLLVQIPPNVLHGFKGVGLEEAFVINTPTEPYDRANPDEYRTDPHRNDIPYDWAAKDG
jgi:dTDP-4-dehydrorhamnose 3,5-epimerase